MGVRNLIIFCVLVFSIDFVDGEGGGGIVKVKHIFGSEADRSLKDLSVHDKNRHGRLLAGIDIPIGGDGKYTGTGLYYAKIGIGNPSDDYYVIVDTGSDAFWVNCIECKQCPTKSNLGIKLKLYNPKASLSAKLITCKPSDKLCEYRVVYGDGSSTDGYLVSDLVWYDQVSGNLATTSADARIKFGCGLEQTGNLASSTALDGLIGFGASSTSMLSQLASSGKVKKKFAHCLDGKYGGGIFIIGDVVEPTQKTTPLIPNTSHYNVIMKSIQVGDTIISNFEAGVGKETIIDSGTTLAYLPGAILDPLRQMIFASQANLSIQLNKDLFECFHFDKSLDDAFPTVTFHFQNSVQLDVYPHDYLFAFNEYGKYCLGWQDSRRFKFDAVHDLIILGDLVLTNKLVVYDLENQVLGLSDHNCSSTIELKDEVSGAVNEVAASHNLSSSPVHHRKDISSSPARYHLEFGRVVKLFLLCFVMFYYVSFDCTFTIFHVV